MDFFNFEQYFNIGNNLYVSISYSLQANDYLLLTDVPCVVSLYNEVCTLQYSKWKFVRDIE